MEKSESPLPGLPEETGIIYNLFYCGVSEICRYYTKPMLPWIISEIKYQNKIQVEVTISRGVINVKEINGSLKMSHPVSQVHKCVTEQADHTCFLYTLRAPDKEKDPTGTLSSDNSDSCQLIPANFNDQNYECHLFQADNEAIVKKFFASLRQERCDPHLHDTCNNSLNSLPDLSVHNESQFFEVLFRGRVKVSHRKVPDTFIDEAVKAFSQKEKMRERRNSGSAEPSRSSHASDVMAYQKQGSGYSVPSNLFLKHMERLSPEHEEQTHVLSKDIDKDQQIIANTLKEPSDPPINEDESLESDMVVEPFRRMRLRTVSGDSCNVRRQLSASTSSQSYENNNVPVMRARAGSIGSMMSKTRSLKYNDPDYKAFVGDFNRTMLFHIGRNEVQLINPEIKSLQLNKSFKDIAHCCQGLAHNDHFGFICREMDGSTSIYVGYVFRCEKSSFTDEIMQSLNRVFNAVHEAQVKDKLEHQICDQCPIKWFSTLCSEVEGLPAVKAYGVIMKKISSLPDEDREVIIVKYEGADTKDPQTGNNVLMMLLRHHFECKQSHHSHQHQSTSHHSKSDFHISTNFESSIRRAKKSLTTSFNQLLKREGDSSERELTPTYEESPGALNRSKGPDKTPATAPVSTKVCLEGISDSPLAKPRPRSSTVSAAGGDSMRKEFRARRLAEKNNAPQSQPPVGTVGPKSNIFLKFGSPARHLHEEDTSASDSKTQTKQHTSFRHTILQRISSPAKIGTDPLGVVQGRSLVNSQLPERKRSRQQLRLLWKKSIYKYILLIRMERENQRLRELQQEIELQRVRLNYDEDPPHKDAVKAWELMLSRPQARLDSNIIYDGIKQGVPKNFRGEVWHLLWVQSQREINSKEIVLPKDYYTPYENMIKELTKEQHAILIDLGRTFPSHPYYQQTLGPGQLSLFNILKAYSLLDQDVGYCQGLSFVGGILLLHVEEEIAFELLKHLMYIKECRRQYLPELVGLQVHMYQLSRLLHDQLKSLYDHLEAHEVTPQLFAAPWFITLFASQFPMNFVVRVFDLLFLKGIESIFCVALSLLKTFEQQLLSCDSFEEIMNYFKTVICNVKIDQCSEIFSQACEFSLKKKLIEYEVEYHVLQEELSITPQHEADIKKLKESNKNLHRQNLDLVEQIHNITAQQQALEVSNKSLHQSQHHHEVRVRWLEQERHHMRQVIDFLCERATPEALAAIPPDLERYLPHKASSPMPVSRRPHHLSISQNDACSSGKKDSESDDMSTELVQLRVPGGRTKSQSPVRSTTLDLGSMQKFIKNL